jgi:hypothetical protein
MGIKSSCIGMYLCRRLTVRFYGDTCLFYKNFKREKYNRSL